MESLFQTIATVIGTIFAIYLGTKQLLSNMLESKVADFKELAQLKERVSVLETKIEDNDMTIMKEIQDIKRMLANLNDKFYKHIEEHE